MATPTTTLGFSNLNTEILQRTSTTQISLNDAGVRLGYGATSQVSLSDLRRAYGATITSGSYTDKFFSFTGYDRLPIGSGNTGAIDDDTINAASPLVKIAYFASFAGSNTIAYLDQTSSPFLGSNIARVATANTLRTVRSTDANTIDIGQGWSFPSSGTVTIGLKWTV